MNNLFLDAACKSAEMTFKQLFDHLTLFVKSPDHRWRLCMRIKRGLIDPNDLGGYGKDQCYFEGMTNSFLASSVLRYLNFRKDPVNLLENCICMKVVKNIFLYSCTNNFFLKASVQAILASKFYANESDMPLDG